MQVRRIDPRDQTVEVRAPRYRVAFRGVGRSSEQWEISGADVDEVQLWTQLHADGRTHSLWVVIPDGAGTGTTSIRLRGVDAHSADDPEPSWSRVCGPVATPAGWIESITPTRTAQHIRVTVAFQLDEQFRHDIKRYRDQLQRRDFGRQPIQSRADPLSVTVRGGRGGQFQSTYRTQGGSGSENLATWVFENLPPDEFLLTVSSGPDILYQAHLPS